MRLKLLHCILFISAMYTAVGFLAPRTAASVARTTILGRLASKRSRSTRQAAKRGVFYPTIVDSSNSKAKHKREDGGIEFVAWGQPQALERHRLSGRHMYNPSMMLQDELLECAKPFLPEKPLAGPLEATIIFRFQRPKNHFRSVKRSPVLKDDAPQFMSQRKDLDNLVKFVLDSLNGAAYEDDAQVVSVTAHKVYSENPCTQVWIRPLSPDAYAELAKEPDVSTRSAELAKPPKRPQKPKQKHASNLDSDLDSESEEIEADTANS